MGFLYASKLVPAVSFSNSEGIIDRICASFITSGDEHASILTYPGMSSGGSLPEEEYDLLGLYRPHPKDGGKVLFSVCLSVHTSTGRGGVPQSGLDGAAPRPGLDGGGVPQPGLDGGGVPQPGLDGGGVPQPGLDGGVGYPGQVLMVGGGTPARSGWWGGVPWPGLNGWGGTQGTPPARSGWWGGVPQPGLDCGGGG